MELNVCLYFTFHSFVYKGGTSPNPSSQIGVCPFMSSIMLSYFFGWLVIPYHPKMNSNSEIQAEGNVFADTFTSTLN